MCFYFKQSKDATQLKYRFKAKFEDASLFSPSELFNGFTYPQTPIITNESPEQIQLYQWGFLPNWAKDISFRKHTLNAKYETLNEKPSFKDAIHNRCLIIVDGFYEWQWLDPKGKSKQKYLITLPNNELFTLAGLWNHWTHPQTQETLKTYTIITTEANELMSQIHNSQKRMPFILTSQNEANWLQGKDILDNEVELIALEK